MAHQTNTTNPALPNWTRSEVVEAAPDLTLIHDLLGGTRRMWDQAKQYIRKWRDESEELYKVRKNIETVLGALERVISASVGMLFAKPPTIAWNASEKAMSPHWDNLDAGGTKGTVLVKRFADQCITDGIGILVVDHPQPPTGVVVTAANEGELGLRPTWAMYQRAQAISWRTSVINNRQTITQLVLHEETTKDAGDFGVTCVHRYRVLRLQRALNKQQFDDIGANSLRYVATWTLYELTGTDASKIESYTKGESGVFRNRLGDVADFLPVSIAYTGRTDAPLTAKPPLLAVAFANLAHWQKATNLSFYEDFCAFPQPVVVGDLAPDPQTGKPQKLRVGPGTAVQVATGGSYDIKELAGTALEQLRKGLEEKLYRIASTAMSFLLPQTRAAETAEAKRLDATAENSTLATAAQGIEDAVNSAFEHHAWFLGIAKADAPVMTISRDYESAAMDAQTMSAYAALVKEGFPKRVVLEALQAGGRVSADADLDALELDWEAGLMATQEAQRAQDAALAQQAEDQQIAA